MVDEPREDGDVGDAGAGGVMWRGGEGTWGVDGEDVVEECEEGGDLRDRNGDLGVEKQS